MCLKPSLASTCLSQAVNLSCIVLHHLFISTMILFPLKPLTDHKIIISGTSVQKHDFWSAVEVVPSLSLAGRPRHRSPFASQGPGSRRGTSAQKGLHMAGAGAWLFLTVLTLPLPFFKKRNRKGKKPQTSKTWGEASCRLLCIAHTGLFSHPLPPLLARLEMKMAPLFLSLGPNCSESAAPETLRCASGEGGRDRAVAVCGRSYINTACVDNAAGRMGAGGLCGAGDEAVALRGSEQAVRPMEGRGRGVSGCVLPAVTGHGLGALGPFDLCFWLFPCGSRWHPAGGLHRCLGPPSGMLLAPIQPWHPSAPSLAILIPQNPSH